MQLPPALLSFVFLVASQRHEAAAGPYPKDGEHDVFGSGYLMPRDCVSYCGYNSYCCYPGENCYTQNNVALGCGGAAATATSFAAAGAWSVYTTTYVRTDLVTVTSTGSSMMPAAATTYLAQSTMICYAPDVSCGAICCSGSVGCFHPGKCNDPATLSTGSTYSAPLKGTTATTATVAVTTTRGFLTPAATVSNGVAVTQTSTGGLSAGAIAGIVIGVLALIIILITICLCCCFKAAFDGILGLFGLGSKRRRRTERTEVVERYSRHGSGSVSRRETHGGWFGGGRRTSTVRVTEKRKTSRAKEGGILAGLAVGLAGLWAVLGLKRKNKPRSNASDVSYTTYTGTYTGTSDSSSSSDSRTRDSRRVRR